jgi:hypothetical protein
MHGGAWIVACRGVAPDRVLACCAQFVSSLLQQAVFVIAKFTYHKREKDELSINKGDRVRVRERSISLQQSRG